VGFLERLLDEASHDHIAAHVDVLTEVESRRGCPEAEFNRLGGLPRERAADGPFVADCCKKLDIAAMI
jgi:hypothetical protein